MIKCCMLSHLIHFLFYTTAHPTEVNRRTMLRKHQRIKEALEQQDRPDLLEYERRQLAAQLKAEVMSIWNSDALMRSELSSLIFQ